MQDRQGQVADDERIAKEAKKREQDDKNNRKVPITNREWSKDMLTTLTKSQLRYPPGTANRWVMITNYLNDKLSPADTFHIDEVIVAAHKAALAHAPTAAAGGTA